MISLIFLCKGKAYEFSDFFYFLNLVFHDGAELREGEATRGSCQPSAFCDLIVVELRKVQHAFQVQLAEAQADLV